MLKKYLISLNKTMLQNWFALFYDNIDNITAKLFSEIHNTVNLNLELHSPIKILFQSFLFIQVRFEPLKKALVSCCDLSVSTGPK